MSPAERRQQLHDVAWKRFVTMPSSNPSDFVHALEPVISGFLAAERAAGYEAGAADVKARVEATGYNVELAELTEFVRAETGHGPTRYAVMQLREAISAALEGGTE